LLNIIFEGQKYSTDVHTKYSAKFVGNETVNLLENVGPVVTIPPGHANGLNKTNINSSAEDLPSLGVHVILEKRKFHTSLPLL
jgi:hypothetical protein